MTAPIDILAIAARRQSVAAQQLSAAAMMNTSPEAAIALNEALLAMRIAQNDVDRVRALALEIDALG